MHLLAGVCEMIRDLFISFVIAIVVAVLLFTILGCQPDIVIDDTTTEVVDTLWIRPAEGMCMICRGDSIVAVRAWPRYVLSFEACVALADSCGGRVCAFSEQSF